MNLVKTVYHILILAVCTAAHLILCSIVLLLLLQLLLHLGYYGVESGSVHCSCSLHSGLVYFLLSKIVHSLCVICLPSLL